MLSSCIPSALFLVLLVGSATYAQPVQKSTCKVNLGEQNTCQPFISVPSGCKSATLDLAQTYVAKSCNSPSLFWNYPQNNLTLIIETPFTSKRQSYTIRLTTDQSVFSNMYEICLQSGTETKLTPQNSVSILKSDEQYKVALKFQAPSVPEVFGVVIQYDIVKS